MLAPERPLTISIFHDVDDARERWLALQERAMAAPFQTLEWCERLYAGPGEAQGAAPLIVIIRDRTTRRDVALLPLALGARGNLSVITFADFGLSDYAFPMIARDSDFSGADLARLWPDILAGLPKADLVHFDKLPARHEGLDNPVMGLGGASVMKLGAWALKLPEGWLDYQAILGRKARRDLRRKARKLASTARMKVFLARRGEDAGRLMDSLRRMRAERFRALGRADALGGDAAHAFYRGLAESGAGGMPMLSAMKVNGEVCAIVFGLLRGARFYMLALTFAHGDRELAKCSPGLVLVHETMAELHKHELKTYDFTIGDEYYKKLFKARRFELFEILQPLSARGKLFAMTHKARRRASRFKQEMLSRLPRSAGRGRK